MKMITSKREMYEALIRGDFGNTLPVWTDLDAFRKAGVTGKCGIRSNKPGGDCYYNIPANDVGEFFENGMIISQMAPDEKLLLQGEFNINSRHLYYSKAQVPMRLALLNFGKYAHGAMAMHLLRTYLNPSSIADFEVLMEQYPESVIEFGAYDIDLGTVPGRNTIMGR
jgi:hypothetical protein